MKVLHIASFSGNIGDNLSHIGFENILARFGSEYVIDKLEIRKFYNNYDGVDKRCFDRSFIKKMNDYDIVFVGGGGFFDYWVEGSASGTTINMDAEMVAEINVPTIFSSIGCHPHRTVPPGNEEKFRRFFQALTKNCNILIGLRNDGSIKVLESIFPDEMATWENVYEILDNGFFYETGEREADYTSRLIDTPYVAINITDDQLSMISSRREKIETERYLTSLVKYVNNISDQYHVVFVPHIYSDLKAIYSVLEKLDQSVVRNKVTVSPCIQGDIGTRLNFSVYANSELVIASRFHANVGPLALGRKVIGLAVLDRVAYMYDSIAKTKQYIDVNTEFSSELLEKSQEMILLPYNNPGLLNEKIGCTLDFYRKALSLTEVSSHKKCTDQRHTEFREE
ncbi:polysaccharide pyruvyl transferase family protein [Halopseudomonas sp. SMJS2]|uniref:polysaccharide pyruvyl transferase family protein n=1 Tax=Halopseudomonas sp. SMJS2 TaxID=3041098 RepID=UPI002452E38D|nr:polysaccharide pyruvyl transferase family protein [Halopseudomonas sp. SMJS2]WGK60365.1 polysaccharide pyruvyl transferase family protein [Halopseudomonas sp. SMJS2]